VVHEEGKSSANHACRPRVETRNPLRQTRRHDNCIARTSVREKTNLSRMKNERHLRRVQIPGIGRYHGCGHVRAVGTGVWDVVFRVFCLRQASLPVTSWQKGVVARLDHLQLPEHQTGKSVRSMSRSCGVLRPPQMQSIVVCPYSAIGASALGRSQEPCIRGAPQYVRGEPPAFKDPDLLGP
jgi:hypothetical protein